MVPFCRSKPRAKTEDVSEAGIGRTTSSSGLPTTRTSSLVIESWGKEVLV